MNYHFIDISKNSSDPHQVILIKTLILFATEGNKEATNYLYDVANEKIKLLHRPGAYSPQLPLKYAKDFLDKNPSLQEGEIVNKEQHDQKNNLNSIPEDYRRIAIALKNWWRNEAVTWWSSSGRSSAFCDQEGEPVPVGEGYKIRSRLICENCAIKRLENTNWNREIIGLEKDAGAPKIVKELAEKILKNSGVPEPSLDATFVMRIDNVSDVMVAGSWSGQPPRIGDDVEIVTKTGIKNARIQDQSGTDRIFYYLAGIESGDANIGDILQKRPSGGTSENNKQASNCFIATEVFGDNNCHEIIKLRYFRDHILINYGIGKKFISFYYKNGPILAKTISKRPKIKNILRLLLKITLRF